MRKLGILFLAFVMILACVAPAYAAVPEDSTVSPQYLHIQTASTNLLIDQNTGVSTCIASCLVRNGHTIDIICRLQKYGDVSWTTIKTWRASGDFYVNLEKDWAVYSGYTYRVYTTYIISDSEGHVLESTALTKSVVYPKR